MAAIGWYGPLIDLSSAPSHLADFVQLVVFVHHSTPVQYKPSAGGTAVRTDIQVGDNTRPFFSVSLWGKQFSSSVSAGDIILMQNVKINRFASVVEARTVEYSSILCLVHPYESLVVKGIDELVGSCRVGVTVKEKLRKVIQWVQQQKATLNSELRGYKVKPATKNWKVHQEQTSSKCQTLSQVLHLRNSTSSNATFHACVSEIFLPYLQDNPEKERMFISRRLRKNIVEDLICTGCQLCGCPLGLESASKLKNGSLYCEKSSNHVHMVGMIYRPFMLYVWDDFDSMPILVKNKAAQLLFGNIRAEKVYQSYKEQKTFENVNKPPNATVDTRNHHKEADENLALEGEIAAHRSLNLYLIWQILLRTLLLQGKNSSLEFVVSVNPSVEIEDGRFEMVSMSMPCFPHHQELSK